MMRAKFMGARLLLAAVVLLGGARAGDAFAGDLDASEEHLLAEIAVPPAARSAFPGIEAASGGLGAVDPPARLDLDRDAPPASGGAPLASLRLLDEAYVRGPVVRLGDIADISGRDAAALADIELLPAPQPGSSRRLNAGLVTSRLRMAGVDPARITIDGAHATTATTLALELTGEMLAASLHTHILGVMPWAPGAAQIDITPPAGAFLVPEGDLEIRWEPNPQYRYIGAAAFRGAVLIDNEVQRQVTVRANIEAYTGVVTAAGDIARGRIIGPRDIVVEQRPASQLRHGHFSEAEDVIGNVARSTIFPGTVLTSRHIAAPTLVRRNQVVQVELRAGNMRIQSRARAMSDGAAGDVIALTNLNSKETYHGTVREDGVVMID